MAEVLAAFFARQGKSVLSALGSDGDWWDGDRWNRELKEDLQAVMQRVADVLGPEEATRLGYADGYHPDRTVEFLAAVAERYAGNINATTKAQLDETLADEEGDPAHVFEVAEGSRADGVGVGVATFVAGFAAVEAARQIAWDSGDDLKPTKTWHVNSRNPRASHASQNGLTVPIDEPFPNGCNWPGEPGTVEEVAGCKCSVTITIPEPEEG